MEPIGPAQYLKVLYYGERLFGFLKGSVIEPKGSIFPKGSEHAWDHCKLEHSWIRVNKCLTVLLVSGTKLLTNV